MAPWNFFTADETNSSGVLKTAPLSSPSIAVFPGYPIPGTSTPGVSPEFRTRGIFYLALTSRSSHAASTPRASSTPFFDGPEKRIRGMDEEIVSATSARCRRLAL